MKTDLDMASENLVNLEYSLFYQEYISVSVESADIPQNTAEDIVI